MPGGTTVTLAEYATAARGDHGCSAVGGRPVLRVGHTGSVRRERAVRRSPAHDEAGLRESGHRVGSVLRQTAGADAAVSHRPFGQMRGRDGVPDGRHVVRIHGAAPGVRRETRQTGQEKEKEDRQIVRHDITRDKLNNTLQLKKNPPARSVTELLFCGQNKYIFHFYSNFFSARK